MIVDETKGPVVMIKPTRAARACHRPSGGCGCCSCCTCDPCMCADCGCCGCATCGCLPKPGCACGCGDSTSEEIDIL